MKTRTRGGIPVNNAVKAVVTAVAGLVAWLSVAFGDDVLDWGEVGEGVTLLITLLAGGYAAWSAVPKRVTTAAKDPVRE